MTRRFSAFLFLIFVLASPFPAAAEPDGPASSRNAEHIRLQRARFAALVAQLSSGKTEVSYAELRLAYPFTESYDPYDLRSGRILVEVWNAFNAGDCKTAIAKTDEVLVINFVSIAAHMIRFGCFAKLGDTGRARRELAIGSGLGNSLLASGDGKTIRTAYVVVTLAEQGYALASENLTKESLSLVYNSGHIYDLINATQPAGGKVGRYFNVDHFSLGDDLQAKEQK
jgi:Domain of unknown function (DUF4919)